MIVDPPLPDDSPYNTWYVVKALFMISVILFYESCKSEWFCELHVLTKDTLNVDWDSHNEKH